MAVSAASDDTGVIKSRSGKAIGVFMTAFTSRIGRNMIVRFTSSGRPVMAAYTAGSNTSMVEFGSQESCSAMTIRTFTCFGVPGKPCNRRGARGNHA